MSHGRMPPRSRVVVTARGPTAYTRARNEENQDALDRLTALSKEARYSSSSHYAHTFRKGIKAVAQSSKRLETVEDARAIPGVGRFLASLIVGGGKDQAAADAGGPGGSGGEGETNGTGRKRARPRAAGAGGGKKKTKKKDGDDDDDDDDDSDGEEDDDLSLSSSSTRRSSAAAGGWSSQAPKKRAAYDKAVGEAVALSDHLEDYGDWRVILLVDGRERKAEHVRSKLLQAGIDCERRFLPIGDMLWIARGTRRASWRRPSSARVVPPPPPSVEVVLGTVVERKSLADLAASMFGTRFEEQRLRLRHSAAGASQVLFLVEGTPGDLPNCPYTTLHTAILETKVHLGFAIVQTKNLDETVRCLKRIHRRVLHRTFPSHFRGHPQHHAGSASNSSAAPASLPTFGSPPAAPRRRPHPQDAAEGTGGFVDLGDYKNMTFQGPPVVLPRKFPSIDDKGEDAIPQDDQQQQQRVTLYEEFKAQIEWARASGTRSVRAVFGAMLKQVDTMSVTKVAAVTETYPTWGHLLQAYDAVTAAAPNAAAGDVARLGLIQDIRTRRDGRIRACRIGQHSSRHVALLCNAGRGHLLGGRPAILRDSTAARRHPNLPTACVGGSRSSDDTSRATSGGDSTFANRKDTAGNLDRGSAPRFAPALAAAVAENNFAQDEDDMEMVLDTWKENHFLETARKTSPQPELIELD